MRKSGAPSFRQVGNNLSPQTHVSGLDFQATRKFQAFKAVVPIPNAARNTASILGLLESADDVETAKQENEDRIVDRERSLGGFPRGTVSSYSTPKHHDKPHSSVASSQKIEISDDPKETNDENSQVSGERIYTVVFGKQSTKKHKTYESDGTLEVGEKSLVLKDEDGKIVGRSALKKEAIEEGSCLNVGSKSIQIVELASATDLQNVAKRPGPVEEAEIPRTFKKAKKYSKVCVPIGEVNDRGFKMEYTPLIMPRPSNEHQWRHNDRRLPLTDVSVDPCLARVLRPHQRAGVVFLYECVVGLRAAEHCGAILADEMGLGKTLQCITLTWILLKQGPYGRTPIVNRVLIVTPSSLAMNWSKEFTQWLGRERIQTFVVDQKNKPKDFVKLERIPVMIISYEMFVRYFEEIQAIRFDLLICDEGHRLKNTAIRTSTLLAQLECKRRVLLTGTPVQNDLQEFFALVNFVNPGLLGSSSMFRKHFEDPIVASRQPDIADDVGQLGEERALELNQLTSKCILRRTQEVIDKYLPTKYESVVFCCTSALQQRVYQAAVDYWNGRVNVAGGSGVAHLGVITALKKICNHPCLVQHPKQAVDTTPHSRSTPLAAVQLENIPVEENLAQHLSHTFPAEVKTPTSPEHSGKLSVVVKLLEFLSGTAEKIVLVSYFTQTLDMFAVLCDEKKYKYCRLDGSTPSAQRMHIVNQFNSPYSQNFVFLLSARAGGVGLNLVGASRLVLYDSDWNPATDLQAMARIWRDGQRRHVHVYRLLTAGSIEEKIFQRQISKTGLSGAVVDPHNNTAIRLSTEELKDLFTFHSDVKCLTHDLLDCVCTGDGSVPGASDRLPDISDVAEEDDDVVSEEEDAPYSSERNCQLRVGGERAPEKQSLRMNQLYQWEHHGVPFQDEVLQGMGLKMAAPYITFMFRNSSTSTHN